MLPAANVLLTEDGTAKIGDFGLARCKHKTYLTTKADAGTVAYMPPEWVHSPVLCAVLLCNVLKEEGGVPEASCMDCLEGTGM